MKRELILLAVSAVSFCAYILLGAFSMSPHVQPITLEFFSLVCLLGVWQYYLYSLVKILRSKTKGLKKISAFMVVLISGHIGAWGYFFFNMSQSKKRIPETDKIEMRPFHMRDEEQQERKTAG